MKKQVVLFIYAFCLGIIFGAIIWGFLKATNIAIEFIWHYIPDKISMPCYTIIVCLAGGLIIGIIQKIYGGIPKKMELILQEVKDTGKIEYHNLHILLIAAFLPLVFGASLGPEAGLVGAIVALCYWIKDKYKKVFKEISNLSAIGIASALSVIFVSPLFGLLAPIESSDDDYVLPKTSKMIMYFAVITGSLCSARLLASFLGGVSGIPRFESFDITYFEILMFIPLLIAGILLGMLFNGSEHLLNKIADSFEKASIIKALFGGLVLGVSGIFLPYTMFSGEHQMSEVMTTDIPVQILLLSGVAKLLITNICITSGWRGGHIFPIIFSGVCIGYGVAEILGFNPVFASAIVVAALTSTVMRKPLAVAVLLLICFPLDSIIFLLLSSYIAALIRVQILTR